jgi:hypothetical protein
VLFAQHAMTSIFKTYIKRTISTQLPWHDCLCGWEFIDCKHACTIWNFDFILQNIYHSVNQPLVLSHVVSLLNSWDHQDLVSRQAFRHVLSAIYPCACRLRLTWRIFQRLPHPLGIWGLTWRCPCPLLHSHIYWPLSRLIIGVPTSKSLLLCAGASMHSYARDSWIEVKTEYGMKIMAVKERRRDGRITRRRYDD